MKIALLKKARNAWKSWTIWVNGASIAVVASLPDLIDQFPQLQPYVPENFYKAAMLALTVTNIALRFKTNSGLEAK